MDFRNHACSQKLKTGDTVQKCASPCGQQKLPYKLRKHVTALGPTPKASLEAFVDLDLSDGEMARYFDVSDTSVAKLCKIWGLRWN